jgi:PKD repeat protein
MSILRMKHLLIFAFCIFVFHTGLFAEESGDGGLVMIDSITTNQSQYIVGEKISFKGTFKEPGAMEEYSIAWNFGDGNVATGTLATAKDVYANPGRCTPYQNMRYNYSTIKVDNTYAKPGTYTVTFSVENSKGTKYEDSRIIVVEKNDSNPR